MSRSHQAGPIKSHLERLIGRYGRDEGIAIGRIRGWVSTMALLGALERVEAPQGGPRFMLKGGVAIELRLRSGARATKDVDMVFHGPAPELVDALDIAFAEPYRDFAFQRGESVDRGPHAKGFDVRLTYQTRAWGTVRLEVSGPGAGGETTEVEFVRAIGLEEFGLVGPAEVACLPLRFQIAQKIHAVTERPANRENRRFRDLVDLLLLRDLVEDLGSLRAACEATFADRATHSWPPRVDVPDDSWRAGYAQLAAAVGLGVLDVDAAANEVAALVAAIEAHRSQVIDEAPFTNPHI